MVYFSIIIIFIIDYRYILNKYFRINTQDQDVEWGYSFDVHLNAFFPPLILLHFFQLFFYDGKFRVGDVQTVNWLLKFILGFISHEWFISRLLGNTFWLLAVLYYMYITFLGYSSLQILHRTHLILTPVPLVLLIYIISLTAGFNFTHSLMTFYKHRVL